MSDIQTFASSHYVIWAQPDEGSYNWQLHRLGSRYDKKSWNDIPSSVTKIIIKNASEYYPIMIIDGYVLDNMFDKFSLVDKNSLFSGVVDTCGQHPRIVVGSEKGVNSVDEFIRKVKNK